MPPVPVPKAVMVVPAVTPVPLRMSPTINVPEPTAETVRVVPEIAPVTDAGVMLITGWEAMCAPSHGAFVQFLQLLSKLLMSQGWK